MCSGTTLRNPDQVSGHSNVSHKRHFALKSHEFITDGLRSSSFHKRMCMPTKVNGGRHVYKRRRRADLRFALLHCA